MTEEKMNPFRERLTRMLEDAWSVRQAENYGEGRRILKEAEELCTEDDDQSRGRIFAIYAQYDRDNGDLESALELSKRSLEFYEKSGNQQRIAHSARHIADIQSGLGKYSEAEVNYQKALRIYRESPETDTLNLANAIRPYGILLKERGRIDEAKTLLTEAKKLYQEVDIQAGVDEMQSQLSELSGQ